MSLRSEWFTVFRFSVSLLIPVRFYPLLKVGFLKNILIIHMRGSDRAQVGRRGTSRLPATQGSIPGPRDQDSS